MAQPSLAAGLRVIYAPSTPGRLTGALAARPDSAGAVQLNHPHCARFCVLGGGSCSVAGDREFQSPFLSHFVGDWQARGFVGTDWKVPTVFAESFSRLALSYFLEDGLSIGEAFRRASDDAFALGNHSRLESLDKALRGWNEDGSRSELLGRIRERVRTECERYPGEGDDSQRARCMAFLS